MTKRLNAYLSAAGVDFSFQLQAQHVGGILDQILIEVVALVDGQGKRLVLRHGQLLYHILHFGHIAVALQTAVTVVIDSSTVIGV